MFAEPTGLAKSVQDDRIGNFKLRHHPIRMDEDIARLIDMFGG